MNKTPNTSLLKKSFTFHLNVYNMVVKDSIVLSVLRQFPPCLRYIHECIGPSVDCVELDHSVRMRFVDALELNGVVVQCQTEVLAKVFLHVAGRERVGNK